MIVIEKEKQSSVELEKKIEELEKQTEKKELEGRKQNGQNYFDRSQETPCKRRSMKMRLKETGKF